MHKSMGREEARTFVYARLPTRRFADACVKSQGASIVAWCRNTVASGLGPRAMFPDENPDNRTRRPGGGRKTVIIGEPGLVD